MTVTNKVLKWKTPKDSAGVLYANEMAVKTGDYGYDYDFDALANDIRADVSVKRLSSTLMP